jgi:hypothetical protein
MQRERERERERDRELCPALRLSQKLAGQYPVRRENNFTFQTGGRGGWGCRVHFHAANWNIIPANKLIFLSTREKREGYKTFDTNDPGAIEYPLFGEEYFAY